MVERRSSKPNTGVRFSLPLFLSLFVINSNRHLNFYKRIVLLSKKKRNFFFNRIRRRSLYYFFKARQGKRSTLFYFFYFSSRRESLFYFFHNTFSSELTGYWEASIFNLGFVLNFFSNLLFIAGAYMLNFVTKNHRTSYNRMFFLDFNTYFFILVSFFLVMLKSQNHLYLYDCEFAKGRSLSVFYKKPTRSFNLHLKPFYVYFNYLITKYISLLARTSVTLCILHKPTALLSSNDIIFFLYFFKVCKISQFKLRSVFKPHDFFGLVFFSFRWFDFAWLLQRLQGILNLISIFKHRHFWNYFFSLIQRYIYVYFSGWHLTGVYISLRGKIGVVGNSRKRRLLWQIGKSSPSHFKKIIQYKQTFFYTSTGAIGFRIWVLR